MKPPGIPAAPGATPNPSTDPKGTGLPGFKTWGGVYFFVLLNFVAWVVLLTYLTHAFP